MSDLTKLAEPVAEVRNNNLYWLVDDSYEISDGPLYARPPALAAELAEVKKALAGVETAFRVNMLRLAPQVTHEEIEKAIRGAKE